MRVFRGSHLRLVLAEFPLLFAISYFPIQVSEKGASSAMLDGQDGDFSGPLDDLCIESQRIVRR